MAAVTITLPSEREGGASMNAVSAIKIVLSTLWDFILCYVGQVLILLSTIVLLGAGLMSWSDLTLVNGTIVIAALACHVCGWYLYFRVMAANP